MAAFERLDWTQFDVWAIASMDGVVVVDERHADACRAWLARHDYAMDEVDCSKGLVHLVTDLEGRILRWMDQFGYEPNVEHRNLNALRDGFSFECPDRAGRVLVLSRPDVPWREDADWMRGLFAIAREHSLHQLAVGQRFFCVLLLPVGSSLIGQPYQVSSLSSPYRRGPGEVDPFSDRSKPS